MPMVKVPYPKHLISFADQISLLKQRGLSFKDEAKALHLLQNISYYRLSGYWFTDTSLFSNSMRHAKILAKIDEEYQRSDEEFVTAFKSKYSDRFPPSWMTMEITSFGHCLFSKYNQSEPFICHEIQRLVGTLSFD